MSIESEIAKAVAAAVAPLTEQVALLRADVRKLQQPVEYKAYKKRNAAQAIDMSPDTLNKLIKAGLVQTVTLPSGTEVVPAASLDALVAPERWNEPSRV